MRKPDDNWWNYVQMHATLPECFKLVLDHGINPDVTGVGGHTTLHHLATATVSDEDRIARATLLLDAGASLRNRDQLLKSTPLGWACRWGRIDLVELYLARGADAREPDAEPWATPLAWATGGHQAITGCCVRSNPPSPFALSRVGLGPGAAGTPAPASNSPATSCPGTRRYHFSGKRLYQAMQMVRSL
jgi:hypothetical protein